MDHGRQHLFARQSAQGHVLPDLLSDGGQCLGEGNDMLVLRAFSHLTEARVVELVINLKARSASIYPCILMRRGEGGADRSCRQIEDLKKGPASVKRGAN